MSEKQLSGENLKTSMISAKQYMKPVVYGCVIEINRNLTEFTVF